MMSTLVDNATIAVKRNPPARPAKAFAAAAVFLLAFLSVAPFRGALPADNPLERVTMVTVMEMWQSGHILYPTLNGQPRLAKPPLAAWISAIFTRRDTITALSNPDPAIRTAAQLQLINDVRLPAVIAACLMLVAILDLGTTVGGLRMGILAAMAGAT